jgi:ribosomal protein S18 acetylase RimI-like enzyme
MRRGVFFAVSRLQAVDILKQVCETMQDAKVIAVAPRPTPPLAPPGGGGVAYSLWAASRRQIYVNTVHGVLRDSQLFAHAAKETRWAAEIYSGPQQQVYMLGEKGLLTPRNLVPGSMQVARIETVPKLTEDYESFTEEFWGTGESKSAEECLESLNAFAKEGMLFTYIYKGHVMAVATATKCSADIARLTGMYTLPPYRGRGFGAMLIYEVALHLLENRGYKNVLVIANSDDEQSNRTYWDLGFAPADIRATWAIELR